MPLKLRCKNVDYTAMLGKDRPIFEMLLKQDLPVEHVGPIFVILHDLWAVAETAKPWHHSELAERMKAWTIEGLRNPVYNANLERTLTYYQERGLKRFDAMTEDEKRVPDTIEWLKKELGL